MCLIAFLSKRYVDIVRLKRVWYQHHSYSHVHHVKYTVGATKKFPFRIRTTTVKRLPSCRDSIEATFGFLRDYAVITPVKSYHIILAREAPLRPPIVFPSPARLHCPSDESQKDVNL